MSATYNLYDFENDIGQKYLYSWLLEKRKSYEESSDEYKITTMCMQYLHELHRRIGFSVEQSSFDTGKAKNMESNFKSTLDFHKKWIEINDIESAAKKAEI